MPALTLPRSELIDQNVLKTIMGITTGNNFQITLTGEMIDPANPETPADFLAVVWPFDDQPAPDNDTPNDDTPIGHQQWYRPYWILVYLMRSREASINFKTWTNIVRAEVEKAMMVDRNRGVGGDGNALAEDTYCKGPITFQDANDARGVIVQFLVKYRTAENNPYLPA